MTVAATDTPPVLEVRDIRTRFHTQDGTVHAVNGVSFDLRAGELLGVVGESGSGKSVTMMSLLKLLPMPPAEITSGSAYFDGHNLIALSPERIRDVRGRRIGFIFQDPMTSLNPVLSVGYQLSEHLRKHMGMNRRQARARAAELLDLVGIPSASPTPSSPSRRCRSWASASPPTSPPGAGCCSTASASSRSPRRG